MAFGTQSPSFGQHQQAPPPKSTYSTLTVSLSSPESILERSHGEVLKPETINYRSFKPEKDGLFCEKIFGPVKDWECHCGKYKRIRYKGIICDRCGVEVTQKKVRRERFGHITLSVPVVHIWYFKSLPNKIAGLLGIKSKDLEKVVYYEQYVVVQAGSAKPLGVEDKQLLSEDEYFDVLYQIREDNSRLGDEDPDKFIAKIGGEAVEELLKRLDLDPLSQELRFQARTETSQQRKAEALKRLAVVENFRQAHTRMENRPEWMVLKVVPVIPPELRPLVPLEGGRFATSDLNDLYRRVIIRNNRLKRLIDIKAPEVILRNEKRMLQEAVDSLFDNSRKANAVRSRLEPRAEVAVRHAQGQAGPLPPEPARQARRLLRPFGDRGRAGAEAARVRPAEGDGRRALQAVHHPQAHRARDRQNRQERQEGRRPPHRRRVRHSGEGHRGPPRAAQPRADAPPPRHPGLPAGPHRGQGDPPAPARDDGLQRRLRRRPDGRPRPARPRGRAGGAAPDAREPQHPQPGARRTHRGAEPGHDPGDVLHDEEPQGREGRRPALCEHRRRAPRLRPGRHRAARQHPAPPRRADVRRHGAGRRDDRHHDGPRALQRDRARLGRLHRPGADQEEPPEHHRRRHQGDEPARGRALSGRRSRTSASSAP